MRSENVPSVEPAPDQMEIAIRCRVSHNFRKLFIVQYWIIDNPTGPVTIVCGSLRYFVYFMGSIPQVLNLPASLKTRIVKRRIEHQKHQRSIPDQTRSVRFLWAKLSLVRWLYSSCDVPCLGEIVAIYTFHLQMSTSELVLAHRVAILVFNDRFWLISAVCLSTCNQSRKILADTSLCVRISPCSDQILTLQWPGRKITNVKSLVHPVAPISNSPKKIASSSSPMVRANCLYRAFSSSMNQTILTLPYFKR